jgi:hypothetical protein
VLPRPPDRLAARGGPHGQGGSHAAAARRAAGPLARLALSHVDGGAVSCPADDGSVEVVTLSYPGRGDVDLWISLTGCGGVSNGFISQG